MKSSKLTRIIFWITTGLIGASMLFAAFSYLTNPEIKAAFPQHFGYPGYFRIELAVAKFIGVVVLLLPFSFTLKEWAYAGFFITLLSAFIAHSSVGDPVGARISPLVTMIILALSYYSYRKTGFKSL